MQKSDALGGVLEKSGRTPQFIQLNEVSLRENVYALSILTLSAILLRIELFTDPLTYFLGGTHSDAGLYLWLFRHHLTFITEIFSFETSSFFPYPLTLAWSDNFIFPALLAAPFSLLGAPQELLYNVMLFVAFIASGYCTFRLIFLVSADTIPALVGGFSALFLSYTTTSLGHPQLQFGFCFLLGIELLLRSLKAPTKYGAIFSFLFLGTFLTTVYFAIFLILFPVIFYSTLYALHPNRSTLQTFYRFAIGSLFALPLLAFFASPYMAVKEVFGARAIEEMYAFRATGLSFFSAPPLSLLYSFTSSFSHPEAYLFCGFTLLLGPIICFYYIQKAQPLQKKMAILLSVFFVLAIVSINELYVLLAIPHSIAKISLTYLVPALSYGALVFFFLFTYRLGKLEKSLGVTYLTNRGILTLLFGISLLFILVSLGPTAPRGDLQLSVFSLLYSTVPGFDAIRAISRAAYPALLLLPIFFGLSLWLLKKTKLPITQLTPLFLIIIFLENYNTHYALEPRDGAPVVLKTLAENREPNDVALFLPMTDTIKSNGTVQSWKNFARKNVNYMNWALDYRIPTVNGYSGQRTKIMKDLPGITRNFPDTKSLVALSKITNLRYIVFATKDLPSFDPIYFQAQHEYFAPSLSLLEEGDEGYYLFRFDGEGKFSERDHIRAPQMPLARSEDLREQEKVLSFQIKPPYEGEEKHIELKVSELDHKETIVFEKKIAANGQWQAHLFPLPAVQKRGLPFRFQFSSDSNRKVHLKELAITTHGKAKKREIQ